MVHPWAAALPDWVVAGVVLGALLASLVAVAFAVGTRRFPNGVTAAMGGEPSAARRTSSGRGSEGGAPSVSDAGGVRSSARPSEGTRRATSGTMPDGGEARRRAEIRDYLRSIGEPFVEDRRVAGRTVAFYLPDREVAVTFDARDYFALDRAGVRVVLVEYELPGASLGGRLPFETPAVEPVGRPVARAFARLGLPPSASPSAVRSAYRERVKAAHPDHGGDRETFARLREAYRIARERAE